MTLGKGSCGFFLGAVLWPAVAFANPYDLFGANPQSTAMGGAFTSLSKGGAAAYYNPGNLPFGYKQGLVEYGFFQVKPNLSFKRRGVNPWDDPEAYPDQSQEMEEFRRGTSQVENLAGHIIGFAGKVTGGLYAGCALHLPEHRILRERFQLPTRPFFLDYDNRLQRLAILPAVAYRFNDHLAVGVGVSVIADTAGLIVGKVPIGDPNKQVNISTDLSLKGIVALQAGVAYEPLDGLRLGFAFRDELKLRVSTYQEVATSLGVTQIALPLSIQSITLFTPQQVALGVSYAWGQWTFAADATYQRWSSYHPPFPEIQIEYPAILPPSVRARILNPSDPLIRPFWRFHDLVVPHLGVSFAPFERWTFMAGYSYEPTPVPPQKGLTTIIDNEMHLVSCGAEWRFYKDFRFALAGTWAAMKPVETMKDPAWLPDDISDPANPTAHEIFNTAYPGFRGEASHGMVAASIILQ